MRLCSLALVTLSALAPLGGCGPSNEDGSAGPSALDGIYHLTAYTKNQTGCSAEGDSALGLVYEPFLVVFPAGSGSLASLFAVSCTTVADCHAKAQKGPTGGLTAERIYTLHQSDRSDLTATDLVGHTGFHDGTNCVDGGVDDIAASKQADASLRIEIRSTLTTYPAQNNTCDTKTAQAAAEGKPCSRLEVLSAKFVEAL